MAHGESGTRFGTGGARQSATGGTCCDEAITLSSNFQRLWIYSGGTRRTHWDGGTLLGVVQRLGFAVGHVPRFVLSPNDVSRNTRSVGSPGLTRQK
jgi:hypothetical protein